MKKPAVLAAGLDLNSYESNLGPTAGEQVSSQSLSVLDRDSCPILNSKPVHNGTDPRQSQKTRRQRSRHGRTRRQFGRVSAIQAEQRHGRITQSSSRRTPCPVCGRCRNSHCRWGDGVWHCFIGDTNHPPSNIRIGDVIDINGEQAALVTTDGGHSGNSYVFRAHTALGKTRIRQVAKQAPKDSSYMAWIEVVIADADLALAITDFQLHTTPWPELQHLLALITSSAEAVSDCLVKTKAKQGWEQQTAVLERASRALIKQKAMADHFRWHYLGEVE
ncbi:hypothetical protein [Synechococcus sp. MIT S9508]|uniref:hypothetical protein n=1 Tax=Synechococcus sp. MIT S9508 TaxID=1801629 RepID=UPI0007BAFA45|nr:hypothetical protein [Synechococcus sp. MIT S9508]KZR88733.1 hypothetical protein MITS9508_01910 [Synechococcus sp. MIT S9508]